MLFSPPLMESVLLSHDFPRGFQVKEVIPKGRTHRQEIEMRRKLILAGLLTFTAALPITAQSLTLVPDPPSASRELTAAWYGGSSAWKERSTIGAILAPLDASEQPSRVADPSGDTYSLAPVVQDDAVPTGAYAMTSPTETTLTFDGTATNIGANFRGSAGGTFSVLETYSVDHGGPGIDRVSVGVTALNSALGREPWVAAGQVGNAGATLITWRLDVGAFDASNQIQPDAPFSVVGVGVEAYDVVGSLIFSNPALSADLSDGVTLSGTVLLQFQVEGEPVEIAGYDLAEIVVFWDIREILFVDGFESGDTTQWSSTSP